MSTPEGQMGQARSMSEPKRWPLITQPANRGTSYLQDARLVNCYGEKDTATGLWQVRKRFGLGGPAVVLPGVVGAGQGMYNFTSQTILQPKAVYIISGNEVYVLDTAVISGHFVQRVQDFGPIQTATPGTLFGGVGQVKFCQTGGATPQLIFSSGYGAPTYISDPSVKITDSFFTTTIQPNQVPGIVYLDGTLYVMDLKGNIWGSANLDDPTVWSSLNFIVANNFSDTGMMLAQQLSYVVAMKSTSTEIFFDNGNPTGSPLSPLPGAIIEQGCLSPDTVQSIDGILFWVTNDINNVNQVGMMEDLEFQIISTPPIDRFMNLGVQATPFINYYKFQSFGFKFAGHRFYGLTNVSAGISMIYDIDQKLWSQFTSATGGIYSVASVASDLKNNLMAQDISSGAINFYGPDYQFPTDNGVIFPVDVYTPNFDAGVDREKYLSQMRFNADQQPGSTLMIRASDNDYKTWSSWRSINLGTQRPILNDEGSFYRRAYNFRQMAATPFRLRSVDLQMDIGVL